MSLILEAARCMGWAKSPECGRIQGGVGVGAQASGRA